MGGVVVGVVLGYLRGGVAGKRLALVGGEARGGLLGVVGGVWVWVLCCLANGFGQV